MVGNSICEKEIVMKEKGSVFSGAKNRRSFLKNGMVAAGAATMGTALLSGTSAAFGKEDDDHSPITKGDIAILTFLSALEQVEADLWIQYAELGGATNQGLSPSLNRVEVSLGAEVDVGKSGKLSRQSSIRRDRTSRWPTPTTVRFGITKLDKIQPLMVETWQAVVFP
jgi:hypothetical protein